MFTHFNSGARASNKRSCQGSGHFLDRFTQHSKRKNLFFQLGLQRQIISESALISTKDFRKTIKRCLVLFKQKAPEHYGLFCLFNVTICVTDKPNTYANFSNHSIDLSLSLVSATDAEIVAGLMHETIHFWQQESESPHFGTAQRHWQDENRQACELEAIKYELEVLRLVGGTEEEIKFQEKQRGTHAGYVRYQPN